MIRSSTAAAPTRSSPGALLALALLTLLVAALESLNHHHGPANDAIGRAVVAFQHGGASQIVATSIYVAGYLVPIAVLRIWGRRGPLRRAVFGFALQFLFGASLPVSLVPCLQVANVSFVARLLGLSTKAWASAVGGAAVVLALNSLLSGRHGIAGILAGFVVGWVSYRIAFSSSLEFLDSERPWQTVRFQLDELRNLALQNRPQSWDAAYAAGHWSFLRDIDQKPRHYAIAGVVLDWLPQRPSVLDVGCGEAVLYPLLRGRVQSYTGLDFAEAAIASCRTCYGSDPQCSFHAGAFESYEPGRRFDVVIMNELLYYFPLAAMETMCARAARMMADENSLLVISVCRNLKARLCVRRLTRRLQPDQSLRVRNNATGSYWTILVYRRRALEALDRPGG